MEGTGLSTFITTVSAPIKDALTLENLGIIIVAALGISLTLILGRFAFNWVWGKAQKAFKRGK